MLPIKSFYSINFDKNKRLNKHIRFLVFHYTGMKSQKSAIKRLRDPKSKVSCHYFISNDGSILNIVPDKFTSWHAGVSFWKNLKNLNKFSIGIEIQNPGHKYGYKKFNRSQIKSIKYLSLKLAKKYNLKKKSFLGHSDISANRKKDPGEKFPWEKMSKYKIGIWHSLSKKVLLDLRLKKIDNLKKILFFKCLKKIGYYVDKNKKNFHIYPVKAFQRRFRPEKINGKVDLECLEIAKNLIKCGFN